MSAPRPGKRVRVTYEGIYDRVLPSGTHEIRSGGRFVVAPPDAKFEILRPPVKVGDVIETAEELDALPLGAIVLDRDGDAWQRRRGWGWCCTTGGDVPGDFAPFTVVYLPDGAA